MCYKNLFLMEQQAPAQNGGAGGDGAYYSSELDFFDYPSAQQLSHGIEGDAAANTSPMSFASDYSPPPRGEFAGGIDTSFGGVPMYPQRGGAGYSSEYDPFSLSSLLGRRGVEGQYPGKPVYNGFASPPEYAYQQQQHQHLPSYLQIMQGLDQYSSPEDLDVKFAVPPNSLSAGGGNVGSPPSGMINPQTACKVCGDVASGNHFGVLSCEACKSFFRRSVRAGARYACRGSRNCSVEKHTRNRCQYCRLQKCLQTGMRKEAVQEERAPPVTKLQRAGTPTQLGYNATPPAYSPTGVPGGAPPLPHLPMQPSFHYDAPVSPIVPTNLMTQSRMFGSLPNLKMGGGGAMGDYEGQPMTPPVRVPLVDPYQGGGGSRPSTPSSMGMPSGVPSTTVPPYSDSGSTFYGTNQNSGVSASVLVTADMQTEAPPENVTMSDRGIKLEDIFEGAHQSLLRVIEWSKRIPAFTTLSLDDQVKLLKSCWCEHVLLKQATRIGPHSDTLLLSSGITCRKDQIEDPEVRRIVERVSHEISYWFDVLHVDKVEMACLKGIILFNPDAKGLGQGTRKRVEIFQEQILQALENRCKTMYPVTPLRFSKLLLRLPPLRAAALESTQHMEVQRTLGNAKLDTIFGELLDFD